MQYAREPLTSDEASRLANVCQTRREQLVVWTLLDLGLRADELASMKRSQIDWGSARIRVHGEDGPYKSRSRLRVVPITDRVRPLLAAHFAMDETFGMTRRTIHRIVTAVRAYLSVTRAEPIRRALSITRRVRVERAGPRCHPVTYPELLRALSISLPWSLLSSHRGQRPARAFEAPATCCAS